jgi:hypothetical protein
MQALLNSSFMLFVLPGLVQKMKNETVDPAPRNIEVVVFEDGVEIGRQQLAA